MNLESIFLTCKKLDDGSLRKNNGCCWAILVSVSLHELVPWRKWEMKPTKLIPPPYVLIVGGLCWLRQPWTLPWRSFFHRRPCHEEARTQSADNPQLFQLQGPLQLSSWDHSPARQPEPVPKCGRKYQGPSIRQSFCTGVPCWCGCSQSDFYHSQRLSSQILPFSF